MHRHSRLKPATYLEHLAGLDQACRLEHALGLHVIPGATLVTLAPLRGTALTVRRRLPALRERGARRYEQRHQRASEDRAHTASRRAGASTRRSIVVEIRRLFPEQPQIHIQLA